MWERESSRHRFDTISTVLTEKMHFHQSPLAPAIFFSSDEDASIIIYLYVDDQLFSFLTKEVGINFFADLELISGMKMTHQWNPKFCQKIINVIS